MSAKRTQRKNVDNQEEEQPLPQEEVEHFFREIRDRAWTDAEKELDVIRQKSNPGDWSRGYVKALEGILLAFRSGDDKYIYIPKVIQSGSPENLRALKEEFAEFSKNAIHGAYDRGFFRALENYLSLVPSEGPKPAIGEPTPTMNSPTVKQEQDEE